LPVGTRLQGDLYSVGKVLGQGGFGITYLGGDTGLKRAVAIKEFFPQVQGCSRNGTAVQPGGMITQAEYLAEKTKFLAEGQRLAQFQHRHIVKVFSLFEENNTAYMVMELLKGKTLLRIIEEHGPLEETEAVAYVTQIAEALDVIHGSKLLHRDIKPENIIVTEASRAVLLDFGTAREFAAGNTRRMTTTLTPGYAPLEQYGQRARFGAPSDIYSLAATLYHLLTGEIPIQATDRAAGVELPAPCRLNPKVSSRVSSAVLSAMEVRVDSRPQSVGDFLKALREFRPRASVLLDPDPAEPTGGKAGHQTAKGITGVIINVERVGRGSIDAGVTIHVARPVGPSTDRFQDCKSVKLGRHEHSWEIDLAPGYYRVRAHCFVTTRDMPAFATKILESNEYDLIVPSVHEPVTLALGRLADGLHLTAGKASVPTCGRGSVERSKNTLAKKKARVAKGRVSIVPLGPFAAVWPVMIRIHKTKATKARTKDDITLGGAGSYIVEDEDQIQVTCPRGFEGKSCIFLEIAAGSYQFSASCVVRNSFRPNSPQQTTNKCVVNVLENRTVTLTLSRSPSGDSVYLGPG